ncbi:MAG: ADOP family duplicated permease [Acidobacteriota bacterium]
MTDRLFNDVRDARRALRRSPILTAVIVLSLGAGIGVNTIVFSWIEALVLRPIPGVSDASSRYLVETRTDSGVRPGLSWLDYDALVRGTSALDDLMAFRMAPFNVGDSSRTERTYGLLVSGNYFSSLSLEPAAGRFIRPDDVSRAGGESVAVISYDYWRTRFGAAGSAIGQSVRVNDTTLTIVGVTPDGFQGTVLGLQFDLWVPATLAPVLFAGSRELDDRGARGYYVMGRAAQRTDVARAQGEVSRLFAELGEAYPATNGGLRGEVLQFWRASRGPQGLILQGLGVLQGVMFLLLLAVCGNTANMLVAKATVRQREIGVRLAVGAGWWRISRQLFVEHFILAAMATVVGAVIAWWGTNALRAMPLLTTQFPVRFQTDLNATGLLFAGVLGVLSALVFGAAPLLHLTRVQPQAVLHVSATALLRRRTRTTLMAAQVALAIAVLITAALFLQSFRQSEHANLGFRPAGVLLAAYDLTGRTVDNDGARLFAARLLDEMAAKPEVDGVAIAASMPLDIHGLPARSFEYEGYVRPAAAPTRVLSNIVTPGYFRTMGIPLVAGEDFAALRDTSRPPQAVVNEAFVRRYSLDGNAEEGSNRGQGLAPTALGRRLEVSGQTYQVVGVAADSLYESFTESPTPHVYLSYRDRPVRQGEIHVRSRLSDEAVLAPLIARAVRVVDPALPVYNVRTLSEHVDMNLSLRRIPARMFMVLGPLMLCLAAIGVYAVVAHGVSQRTSEIGVRLALGATRRGVVAEVVREHLRVIAVGMLIGWLPVAFAYTHLFRGGLDGLTFVGVPVLLLLIAALACWIPARRAGRIEPLAALRAE